MPVLFTMHADAYDFEAPDLVGAAGLQIHFDLNVNIGTLIVDDTIRPSLVAYRRVVGYIRSDGRMYDTEAVSAAPYDLEDPGSLGVRLLGNDPDLNLDGDVTYRVSGFRYIDGSKTVFGPYETTSVPSTDIAVNLANHLLPEMSQTLLTSHSLILAAVDRYVEDARSQFRTRAVPITEGEHAGKAQWVDESDVPTGDPVEWSQVVSEAIAAIAAAAAAPGAVSAELAARAFGLGSDGEGGVVFESDGEPTGGPSFTLPGGAWETTVDTPSKLPVGVAGDGATDDRAALAISDTAALSAVLPLMLLPGTYKVSSDITISSPLWLTGGVLEPDDGITVTLAGGVVNASMQQIFDTSAGGAVVVKNVAALHPQWWGALGSGASDDQPALQAMLDAATAAASPGQRVKSVIPPGVYRCDDELFMRSNTVVENQGHLKFYGGDAVGEFMAFLGVQNVELYGGVLDSNRQGNDNTLAIGRIDTEADNCENIYIHDVLVLNAAHGGSHVVDIDDPSDVGVGGGKGITVQHGAIDVLISDVILDNCDLGFSVEGKQANGMYASGVTVNNMVVKNSKYMGLYLTSIPSTSSMYAQVSSLTLNNVEIVDCGTGQTTEETPQDCADLFGAIVCQSLHFVQGKNIRVKCNETDEKLTVLRGAVRFADLDVQVFCAGELVDVINSEPYGGYNPSNSTSRYNNIRAQVIHDATFSGYLINNHATYYAAYGTYEFSVLDLNGGSPEAMPPAQYVNNQQNTQLVTVTDLHSGKTTTVQDGTPASQVSSFADYLVNGLAIDDDSGNNYTKIGPTRNLLALTDASGSAKAFVTSSGFLLGSAGAYFSGTTGLFFGSGSPEGVKTAGPGSVYFNSSGGTGTTMYVKETGSGNTGWVAK